MSLASCSSAWSRPASKPTASVAAVWQSRASLIAADANKCRSTPGDAGSRDNDPATVKRAVQGSLANLDDPAWGAASDIVPKFVAPADRAAQGTGALRNAAFFA